MSRVLDNGWTLEVNRLATDGTPNACSALYGAAWRAAKALGYRRVITYILDSEPGTSLRAAGWAKDRDTAGGEWSVNVRPAHRKRSSFPTCGKQRWVAGLPIAPREERRPVIILARDEGPTLFDAPATAASS